MPLICLRGISSIEPSSAPADGVHVCGMLSVSGAVLDGVDIVACGVDDGKGRLCREGDNKGVVGGLGVVNVESRSVVGVRSSRTRFWLTKEARPRASRRRGKRDSLNSSEHRSPELGSSTRKTAKEKERKGCRKDVVRVKVKMAARACPCRRFSTRCPR